VGFRPRASVPSFNSLQGLQPTPLGFGGSNVQTGGNNASVTGRLYLTQLWLPIAKNLVAYSQSASLAGDVMLGIYSGRPATGLTLLGRTAAYSNTTATSYPATQRVLPLAATIVPAGISFLAFAAINLTTAFVDGLLFSGQGCPPGICYYADGLVVANIIPTAIAGGALTDVGVTPVLHPGPTNNGLDLELS
jgi:hypothetical protein